MKDIGSKVKERFDNGSNEVPHFGLDNAITSTNTTPDSSYIDSQDQNLINNMKIEKVESLTFVPDISTLSVKEEEDKPANVHESIAPDSPAYRPQTFLTVKTEPTLIIDMSNKENIAEDATNFSNQLSPVKPEVSSISTIVQPQFRDIQMSAQRKNVLKGFSEEIINKTPKVDNVNTNRRQLKYPAVSSLQCEFLSELNALKDHSNEQGIGPMDDTVKSVGSGQFSRKSERSHLVLKTEASDRKPIKPKITIKHITLTRKN